VRYDVLGVGEFETMARRAHVLSPKSISSGSVAVLKVPEQVLSLFLEMFEVRLFW